MKKKEELPVDETLLAREIVSGRTELFRFFVKNHEKQVFAMGMSFFHNRDDASDFAQEVFLKAFKSLADFQGRSRFSTWLYKIAYNTAINNLNRKKDYVSLAENEPASDKTSPERDLLRSIAREAVRTAVNNLPERYRVCVDLFFFFDLAYHEIEIVTGFPVNTIKSHVFRAKKILRTKLKDFRSCNETLH